MWFFFFNRISFLHSLHLSCVIQILTASNSLNCLAYMLILDNDSNAEVRRAVLSCIAMSPLTLPKVIKRTRDIKENVRVLAYQVTPDQCPSKTLAHEGNFIRTLMGVSWLNTIFFSPCFCALGSGRQSSHQSAHYCSESQFAAAGPPWHLRYRGLCASFVTSDRLLLKFSFDLCTVASGILTTLLDVVFSSQLRKRWLTSGLSWILPQLTSVCLFVCAVETVRAVVSNRMLPAWLLRLDGNVIEMLHRLDVENCAQTALEALKAIFTGSTEPQQNLQLDNRWTTDCISRFITSCVTAPKGFRCDCDSVCVLLSYSTGSWFQRTLCLVKTCCTGELCVSSSRPKEMMVKKCWSECYQMLPRMPSTSMGETLAAWFPRRRLLFTSIYSKPSTSNIHWWHQHRKIICLKMPDLHLKKIMCSLWNNKRGIFCL